METNRYAIEEDKNGNVLPDWEEEIGNHLSYRS